MDSIKREIQEVKETIVETANIAPNAPINWATVAAKPRTHIQTHRPRDRDQEIDEESQKMQAERRLDRAKIEVTLTAEGAPLTIRNKLNSNDYEQNPQQSSKKWSTSQSPKPQSRLEAFEP